MYLTSFFFLLILCVDRDQGKWRGGVNVKKILNGGGGLSINLLKSAAHIFPNATIFSAYGKPLSTTTTTNQLIIH